MTIVWRGESLPFQELPPWQQARDAAAQNIVGRWGAIDSPGTTTTAPLACLPMQYLGAPLPELPPHADALLVFGSQLHVFPRNFPDWSAFV